MAPKRKGSFGAVTVTPVKQEEGETLLEAEDRASSSSAPKRVRTRTFTECVDKALRDNFKGWHKSSFKSRMHNGKTLWDHVAEAKQREDETREPIGKFFYTEARRLFGDKSDAVNKFVVKDESEPIDPLVAKAVVSLTGHKVNMTPMLDLFTSGHAVNQKNLVAVWRACLEVNPYAGMNHANFLIAMCAWCVEQGYDTANQAEWSELVPHLDQAFDKSWQQAKSEKVKLRTWLLIHEEYMGSVLPLAALRRLADAKNWVASRDDLALAIKCVTGSRMYFAKFAGVSDTTFSDIVRQEVEKLAKGPLTQQAIDNSMTMLEAKATAEGKD